MATPSPSKSQDALGGRIERDIIRVLLGLMTVAALWWGSTWWRHAAHAEVVPAPRPPSIEATFHPIPARFDRSRAKTSMPGGPGKPGADAEQAPSPRSIPAPSAVSYGLEQGHGSEGWSRSDAPGRQDFEPRYSLDAGTFVEPPPVAAEAPNVFH